MSGTTDHPGEEAMCVTTSTPDLTVRVRDVAAAGPGRWVRGRTVARLWSHDASTGVWMWVEGVGWKRLAPGVGHTRLTALAVEAVHGGRPVDYREDAVGRIEQILV
ncbi:hypothetical protein [Actinokineospora spheciospongiae]|uniref:hypothetical protein n=1 Tax=Actinokineospora spheciospongiae TaxID=909613 RepID=UPI0011B62347|nr:hypothetical protein [Actinokineospora spheciospongiae]